MTALIHTIEVLVHIEGTAILWWLAMGPCLGDNLVGDQPESLHTDLRKLPGRTAGRMGTAFQCVDRLSASGRG